ncbi:YbaN family protein [Chelativorans sp. AA-79]|uniref:YbaN family protein n=1 Tax=Chelativorans sp. AA-79 TaxID=3028735 RepID=UPI0023F70FCE|nr:YbaN family protein [Chelativorans sp. AA-79]WEX08557.1 YbaN family protein [Chelativorans sp. AA-79]
MTLRLVWILVGVAATACGVAGAVLPLLPTTPFLLVAAYAFARSSPRLHAWLLGHPYLGPLISNWQRHGSIDNRIKRAAITVMIATFTLSWLLGVSATVLAIQAVVLSGAAAFVLTRPSGSRGQNDD